MNDTIGANYVSWLGECRRRVTSAPRTVSFLYYTRFILSKKGLEENSGIFAPRSRTNFFFFSRNIR